MSVESINNILYVFTPSGAVYTASGNNANCTVSACPIETSIYGYRPTLAGSGAAIGLYAIAIAINLFLGIRHKTWGFMAANILGCVDEILGYVGRILYNQNPWTGPGFIMQIVLITIGPVFFCAAIYVMIYKMVNYIDPTVARFNPKLIYWVFICSDILSLILQAVGGAMSSTSNGGSSAGVNIALAGLSLQVATLTFFIAICIDYAIRSRSTWSSSSAYAVTRRFKVFVAFLSLAVVTIFTRCVYRIYELSQGYSKDSTALRDEPLFNGLELSMILIATFALLVAHPGPIFYTRKGLEESPAERKRIAEEKTQVVATSDSE